MKRLVFAFGLAMFLIVAPLHSIADTRGAITAPKVENITGTLIIAGEEQRMIYVKSSDGAVYDFHVNVATKISRGDRQITFTELTTSVGKQLEVVFRPFKAGNAALSIEVR